MLINYYRHQKENGLEIFNKRRWLEWMKSRSSTMTGTLKGKWTHGLMSS
jgi:hypothetical protein